MEPEQPIANTFLNVMPADMQASLGSYLYRDILYFWMMRLQHVINANPIIFLQNINAPLSNAAISSPLAFALSPDGQIMAFAGVNWVEVRNVSTGQLVYQFTNFQFVRSLAFSHDGRYLALSDQNEIRLYDMSNGELIKTMPIRHKEEIIAMSFTPDDRSIVAGDFNRFVVKYNIELERVTTIMPALWASTEDEDNDLLNMAFSPDIRYVVTTQGNGRLKLWDRNSESYVMQTSVHNSRIDALAFNKEGTLLASGDEQGVICIWDIATKTLLYSIITGMSIDSILFDETGRWISCTAYKHSHFAFIMDIENKKLLHVSNVPKGYIARFAQLVADDSHLILIADKALIVEQLYSPEIKETIWSLSHNAKRLLFEAYNAFAQRSVLDLSRSPILAKAFLELDSHLKKAITELVKVIVVRE